MSRRRTPLVSPLPDRDGVPAARVRMPASGTWATVLEFLLDRTGDPQGLELRWRAGEVRLQDGTRVDPATAYRPTERVYLYRDLSPEPDVPGELHVVFQDENIVVVDKPHFLATMPRGSHVRQSVVLRLRSQLDLPELAPAHRLDRLTAGVLLLTTRREVRAAYQQLFAAREVDKEYQAIAPVRADLELPTTIRSRIVKHRGALQAEQEPGEVNAVTEVSVLEQDGGLGRYLLRPLTGRTHQLRIHLAGLGIPIVNDPLYPIVRETQPDDFSAPLRLVSTSLGFRDPLSGRTRRFTSCRQP